MNGKHVKTHWELGEHEWETCENTLGPWGT
jgi:hypothetical protein